MFLMPGKPSVMGLKFPLSDFEIFGSGGVIDEKQRGRNTTTTHSHKSRRSQPNVGDAVGLLKQSMLSAVQVQAIGFVVGKRGTKSNPIYDLLTTDADDKEYQSGLFGFDLVQRAKPFATGFHRNIEARNVVFYVHRRSITSVDAELHQVLCMELINQIEEEIHQAKKTARANAKRKAFKDKHEADNIGDKHKENNTKRKASELADEDKHVDEKPAKSSKLSK